MPIEYRRRRKWMRTEFNKKKLFQSEKYIYIKRGKRKKEKINKRKMIIPSTI